MVLPPNDSNTEKYFEKITILKHELKLQHLSMGMSLIMILQLNMVRILLRIDQQFLDRGILKNNELSFFVTFFLVFLKNHSF